MVRKSHIATVIVTSFLFRGFPFVFSVTPDLAVLKFDVTAAGAANADDSIAVALQEILAAFRAFDTLHNHRDFLRFF